MLLLHNLAAEIKAKGTTEARLSNITGIPRSRLHKLIYPTLRAEAWFDEAVLIARAVGVAGILPLIGAATLVESVGLPYPLPNDLDMLRGGVRLPLGLACNIALGLGLSDPIDLLVTPLHQEIWHMLVERNATCPWCSAPVGLTGTAHSPYCFPDKLWGARGPDVVAITVLPRLPRKNESGGTMPAKGLKALRSRMGLTQAQMAERLGTEANGYAQLERCVRPLTNGMAKRFTQASGIARELFYLDPEAAA